MGGLSLILWGGLYALFYFSTYDYGAYPELGTVRGASVTRFKLNKDSVFISSRRGSGDYSDDVLILSKDKEADANTIRIVRNSVELLFEQNVAEKFSTIEWDKDKRSFVVADNLSNMIIITPVDNAYELKTN